MNLKIRKLTGPGAIFLILFALLPPCLAAAAQTELQQIQSAITEQGAPWIAADNPVFRLTPDEKKRRASLALPSVGAGSGRPTASAPLPLAAASLPAYLNYTNFNGEDFVTPIRDQGSCGSCWAYSTTATLESYVLLTNGYPATDSVNLALSEPMLFCESGAGDCTGGYPTTASDYIQNSGLVATSYYTYSGTCPGALSANWQNEIYKIPSWTLIDQNISTVAELRSALNTYGPIVVGFQVYNDFYSYMGGIYQYVSGKFIGGHEVEVIGYDDSNQCFIVKNSWGTSWGETSTGKSGGGGFFRIAYSQVSNLVQFGTQPIAYGNGIGNSTLSVTLTTSPAGLNISGAQWSVDGGATWHNSGDSAILSPGSYTIAFSSVSGFSTPSSQSVTVTQGQPSTATATYVYKQGTLTVSISPNNIGGKWQVDLGAWLAPSTVSIAPGSHTVGFGSVSGYATPASQTVIVSAGTNTTLTGTYTQQSAGPWQSASNLGSGWEWLSWFGSFCTSYSPWIYHSTLGWLYPYGTSANSIWFYDPQMKAFWWTSATAYPYVYRSDGVWLFYEIGSSPRKFYNFKTSSWEND